MVLFFNVILLFDIFIFGILDILAMFTVLFVFKYCMKLVALIVSFFFCLYIGNE